MQRMLKRRPERVKLKQSYCRCMYILSLFSFQSMAQFKWHDGSVKNVHVDPTILFDYQVCPYSLYTSVSLIIFFMLFLVEE